MLASTTIDEIFCNITKEKGKGYDDQDSDAISKLEFEVENNIYRMLRNEFIITNNSPVSLCAVPLNNRLVYYNADKNVHEDPFIKSVLYLNELINKSNMKNEFIDDLDDLRPYEGFGKPLKPYTNRTKNQAQGVKIVYKKA